MNYWLLKSEPDVFSIDDLRNSPNRTQAWDGVRNYQARNMIRDDMRPGDRAFFYHSSCAEPGIVGIMEISSRAHPDVTALDPSDAHFDPKSTPEDPRWFVVDVRFLRKLRRPIGLPELRAQTALRDMPLLRRGNRLSVMPVTEKQWRHILELEAAGSGQPRNSR